MIFKTWSPPRDSEVWAKYAASKNILIIIAIAGNLISGFSEFKAMETFWSGIVTVILLEGGIWFFGSMFFDNLFSALRNKDLSSIIFGAIGLLAVVGIFILSINLSLIGKTKIIEDRTPHPSEILADSTAYNLLKNKALNEKKSMDLFVESEVKTAKVKKKADLEAKVSKWTKEKARIMNFADYNYDKYANAIKRCETIVKEAKLSLKRLNSDTQELEANKKAINQAKYHLALLAADTVLLNETKSAALATSGLIGAWQSNMQAKQFFTGLLVKAGIVFSLFYLFFNGLGRFLSGSFPIYKNPFQNTLTPAEKIKFGLRLRYMNIMNAFSDRLMPKKNIKVKSAIIKFDLDGKEDTFQIKEKPPTPAPTSANQSVNEPPKTEELKNNIPNPQATPLEEGRGQTPVTQPNTHVNTVPYANIPKWSESLTNMTDDEKAMKQHDANLTAAATVHERVKGFDYTKTRRNIENTYKKMKETAEGTRGRVGDGVQTSNTRMKKIIDWTQELVYQGYKVTIDPKGDLKIDDATTPTFKNQILRFKPDHQLRSTYPDGVSIHDLIQNADDFDAVRIIHADNNDKFPILIKYPSYDKYADITTL
ncbi:MAG: hypothetical protein ACPGFK_00680 [Flavobacteriaceae bacterium]